MKNKWMLVLLVVFVFAFLALNVRVGYAEPSAAPRTTGYEISWFTVDGGGAQDLTGGTYTLSGTIGQFDAGSQSGGSYTLAGGFWNAFANGFGANINIFLPFIRK